MLNRSDRQPEVAAKLVRLRQRMAERQVNALILHKSANTAWITAGAATYVNEATDGGASSLLITPKHAYVLTDGVEAPRLTQEERLVDLGFELVVEKWYVRGQAVDKLIGSEPHAQDGLGNGVDFETELKQLRLTLQSEEVVRIRHTGKLASEAMDQAVRSVRPGDTEYELAGRLANAARARGGSPIVTLIASDDRIFQYRHPLPTAKAVERYAMLVLCMRLEGLIVSTTRLIHFGKLPDELRTKMLATAHVDARLIIGTQPGRTMGEMFEIARQAYQEQGYPEAIEEHHQGGSAGYATREVLARPGDTTVIEASQVFAWNPSIRGVKSEDTILLKADGSEILTETPNWPVFRVESAGHSVNRPAILEV